MGSQVKRLSFARGKFSSSIIRAEKAKYVDIDSHRWVDVMVEVCRSSLMIASVSQSNRMQAHQLRVRTGDPGKI